MEEEELRTQDPDFWNDAKAAEAQMKKVRTIKSWLEGYKGVKSAIEELQLAVEFQKEGELSEEEVDEAYNTALQQVEELEMKNMLSREEDQMGAVLKIVAGAGGTEAQDWAEKGRYSPTSTSRPYWRYPSGSP